MTDAALALSLDLPPDPIPYHKTVQTDPSRCFFCGEPESSDHPIVAILTWIRWSERHYVHSGACHDAHSAKVKAERELQRKNSRARAQGIDRG